MAVGLKEKAKKSAPAGTDGPEKPGRLERKLDALLGKAGKKLYDAWQKSGQSEKTLIQNGTFVAKLWLGAKDGDPAEELLKDECGNILSELKEKYGGKSER